MSHTIVELLSHWYCKQTVCVQWQNGLSDAFCIKNGVRQGSLLAIFIQILCARSDKDNC